MHGLRLDRVFLGLGIETEKSAALLPVSVHPADFLTAAVVLLSVPTGLPLEKLVAPYPTKSAILAPEGEVPLNIVEFRTRATFPAVALKAIVPDPSN